MESGQKTTNTVFLKSLQDEKEAARRLMLLEMAKIEETTRRFEHAATKGCGLIPRVEIPQLAYHAWAAKFKQRDMDAGITITTGYECWRKGSGFYEWWVKKNQRLQYREAKNCAQTSIIVPATKYTKVTQAA